MKQILALVFAIFTLEQEAFALTKINGAGAVSLTLSILNGFLNTKKYIKISKLTIRQLEVEAVYVNL